MDSAQAPSFPSAPLDAAALERALLPFGQSTMLPREAYTDEAVFRWESRHFLSDLMCAGLGAELPDPGDQRAAAAGEGSILLVRGEDGAVRAFANTCRHRGHELLPCGGQTRQGAIICPYHAWTYGLDGRLRHAPSYRDLDSDEWGLVELPVAEWHGLIFTGTGAAGVTDRLAELDDMVAPYEPERLAIAGQHTYEVAANWKVLAENYHECYHCPSIHPELCRVSPPQSGQNYEKPGVWNGGSMELRDGMATMSLDGTSSGVPLRGVSGAGLRSVNYLHIFPNVLVSLHPDYVMTHRLVPAATDRTRIECFWAFAPEAVARPGFDPSYGVEFWDVTNRQDWAACESVQRGLSSPHARPGPLSPRESGVYSFVTAVARGYLGSPAR
jgi:Rieske 2Fe-2S family protein